MKTLQQRLISACENMEEIPNEVKSDLNILRYTFEVVSPETAKAFYYLIMNKRQHDFPIITNLKRLLGQD